MTRIHFVGGEKGGVGKSVVSRVLSQYFIDRQIPFLGFDTDCSHGSLLRFYAGFASPVVMLERQRVKQWLRRAYEELDKLAL